MHSLLCVCLPRSEARSSLQARKKVSDYLTAECFDTPARFSGRCDYFGVGGLWSGWLTVLRLKSQDPKRYKRFLESCTEETTREERVKLFKEAFPKFRGKVPVGRKDAMLLDYGYPDDAQIMDEPLFQILKKGFCEEIPDSDEGPAHVIFATESIFQGPDSDFPWPKNGTEAAEFWVVVIDYHG